jgi:UDP-N-acetylbacillosamine N-acetyltransferase
VNKSIYIYGASGHGLVVADIAKALGYNDVVFVDDGDNEYIIFEEVKENIDFALGIGDNYIREKLFNKAIKNGFDVVSLIHPSAIVSSSSTVGKGVVIMPNVVVNAKSKIGKGVILNTGCIIEHENLIDDFVHISPNVALACGLPVISSDCKSGPREILGNEEYGLLYSVGDIEMLVVKMKQFLYGDIDLDSMQKNNLDRLEDFKIDKIMHEFQKVLKIE